MIDIKPKSRIAIALGDQAGIGPEVALKAVLDHRVRSACYPILVGDRHALERHARLCGINVDFRVIDRFSKWLPDENAGVCIYDLDQLTEETLVLGEIRPEHGRAAIDAAGAAITAALEGDVDGVVACPHTELAIKAAGIEFDGYPSFVARRTETPVEDTFLMLCFDGHRIIHTTLHVSLRRAIELITLERVERVIRAAHTALLRLGVSKPRIAVSGLNPLAGKDGRYGDEEAMIIAPAIARARSATIDVEGPFGADTIWDRPGFDAFIVMVHDQGHLPAKILATNRAAALTIGTPILFSSVAHGSALDIAGQNKASPEAVIDAVRRLSGASDYRGGMRH